MSQKRAVERASWGGEASSKGVWGRSPQQAKKGRSPPAPQELFWGSDI